MNKKIKYIATERDYYCCSACSEEENWHKVSLNPRSIGFKHLKYIDIEKSNDIHARMFYCFKCKGWHYANKKPQCLPYRAILKKDNNHDSWINNSQISSPSKKPKKLHREKPEFDGVFWFKKEEVIESMGSPFLKEKCIELLDKVDQLYDEYHIHTFSRDHGFSFFVKGLKIAELSIKPSDSYIILEKNTLKSENRISVDKERIEKRFFEVLNSEILEHFKVEARNIISLREKNRIGYVEKWLHSLLIEDMRSGRFTNLEYLYYEAPGGRIRSGRTHIDILAKDRISNELVLIEVKKENQDIDEAICQGFSYLTWVRENDYPIQKKINELKWGVNASKSKLMIITPDHFLPKDISEGVRNFAHRFNFKVEIVSLNSDWKKDEKLKIINQFEI